MARATFYTDCAKVKNGLALGVRVNAIVKNLKAGDRLILTKPLGTGIINTAIKGGLASCKIIEQVTSLMVALNKDAAEVMKDYPVHACTDITGFGLLGHLAEMVVDSKFAISLWSEKIPIIPEAFDYAAMGLVPAGAYKNKEFREAMVDISPSVKQAVLDIMYDPQTSGGLLICVESKCADELKDKLIKKGMKDTVIIGEVLSAPEGRIVVE